MDWYLRKEIDFIVPNDQEELEAPWTDDLSPLPYDWCHWGFISSEKFKSPNIYSGRSTKSTTEEFVFDRQSPCVQGSKGLSVHDGEGSNTSACGARPSDDCSARTLEASFYGQTDFQLQNSMDWMDEIFLNSLLEEDHRNMENPLQSLNIPDSICRSLPFENPLTNMLIDPQSQMKDPARREASLSTCSIPLLTNDISGSWGKTKNCSPSCLMLEESKRSEGSTMDPELTVLVPELSASNESEAIADVDEPKCLEATVLQELEDVMLHLSGKMRICFRDALYRLAKSSKEQQKIRQTRSADVIDRQSFVEVNSESPSLGRSDGESKTNVIDRTIAKLMFNNPYYQAPDFPCPGSLHGSAEILASPGSYYSPEQPVQPHYYEGPT